MKDIARMFLIYPHLIACCTALADFRLVRSRGLPPFHGSKPPQFKEQSQLSEVTSLLLGQLAAWPFGPGEAFPHFFSQSSSGNK